MSPPPSCSVDSTPLLKVPDMFPLLWTRLTRSPAAFYMRERETPDSMSKSSSTQEGERSTSEPLSPPNVSHTVLNPVPPSPPCRREEYWKSPCFSCRALGHISSSKTLIVTKLTQITGGEREREKRQRWFSNTGRQKWSRSHHEGKQGLNELILLLTTPPPPCAYSQKKQKRVLSLDVINILHKTRCW